MRAAGALLWNNCHTYAVAFGRAGFYVVSWQGAHYVPDATSYLEADIAAHAMDGKLISGAVELAAAASNGNGHTAAGLRVVCEEHEAALCVAAPPTTIGVPAAEAFAALAEVASSDAAAPLDALDAALAIDPPGPRCIVISACGLSAISRLGYRRHIRREKARLRRA